MVNAILTGFLLVILAYILGSIPPAYLIGKIFYNTDIRKQGSGNVGGANAGRLFGKKVLIIVGALDILKGTSAILVGKFFFDGFAADTGFFAREENILTLIGFFVVLGHCFSLFLRFQGGKGGATTAGVVLALDPIAFLILILFWILIVSTTRFTSLGNLLGIVSLPFILSLRLDSQSLEIMGYSLIVLIYYKHRENINRLFAGKERKFGTKEAITNQEN